MSSTSATRKRRNAPSAAEPEAKEGKLKKLQVEHTHLVNALDLSAVLGAALHHVTTEQALEEFRRFLFLKLAANDSLATQISPTPLMDHMWHAAVLDTSFYLQLQAKLGMSLTHIPFPAEPTDEQLKQRRLRRLRLLVHYLERFDDDDGPLGEPWPEPEELIKFAPAANREHKSVQPAAIPGDRRGGGMQIIIKDLLMRPTVLDVNSSDTIEDVKKAVMHKTGIPIDQQHLVYKSMELEDGQTLADYHIQSEDTLYLVAQLRGC